VGIGTTNPVLALELAGTFNNGFAFQYFNSSAGLTNSGLVMGNNGGFSGFLYLDNAGFNSITPGSVLLDNDGQGNRPDVVIEPTHGYVGIGNGNPSTNLDLAGSFRFNNGAVINQGDVLTAVDNTGLATWSQLPSTNTGFNANASSVNVPDAVYQPVVYPTVVYDDGGNYNASTGVYTAPAGGVYHFDASIVYFSFSSPGSEADIRVLVTSGITTTEVAGNTANTNVVTVPGNPDSDPGGFFTISLSTDLKLAAGDQVQITAVNFTGTTETEGGGGNVFNYFSGHRVY
jgi:hypothetical protein